MWHLIVVGFYREIVVENRDFFHNSCRSTPPLGGVPVGILSQHLVGLRQKLAVMQH